MRFEKLKVWQDNCRLPVEATKAFSTFANYSLKIQTAIATAKPIIYDIFASHNIIFRRYRYGLEY